jgi:ComF family protein
VPGPVCQECKEWPPSVRAARSACLLRTPADTLVHELKYRGWHRLASSMATRMAAVSLPADVAEEARIVVPVPTTSVRLRERGYNQAALLARAVAEQTDRRTVEALRRGVGASSQTALQPAARLANVAGAFAVTAGAEVDIAGEHLLLVDDVLTTGATVIACSDALVVGGARCVSVLTFARAVGRLRLD